MRKPPLRMECPACLGLALERRAVAEGIAIDHCGRCGGTWIPRAQIQRLRAVPTQAVRAMITRVDDAGFLCHSCHAPMERDAARCPACAWANTLACPTCGKGMRRTAERDVTVDVCRGCEGVWLDHHELSSLWAVAAAAAVANHGGTLELVASGGDATSFLLDALFYGPDLVRGAAYVAGEGVELAATVAHAAGTGLEAVSNAGGFFSVIGSVLEVAGDAAGTVFGAIADVFGIFDGL